MYLQVSLYHVFLVPILLFHLPTHLPSSLLGPVFGRVGRVGNSCFPFGCLSLELALVSQRGLCRSGSFELYLFNGVKGGSQEEWPNGRDTCPFPAYNPSVVPLLSHWKARVLTRVWRHLVPSPHASVTLPPSINCSPPCSLLQPHWPGWSSNTPGMCLPPGLCMGHPFCVGCSFRT